MLSPTPTCPILITLLALCPLDELRPTARAEDGEHYVELLVGPPLSRWTLQCGTERTENYLARPPASACCQAMREELQRWIDLRAFERAPLGTARRKVVDGVCRIMARLAVRGFRDSQVPALSTFSATTSRWKQRLIVSCDAHRQCTPSSSARRVPRYRQCRRMPQHVAGMIRTQGRPTSLEPRVGTCASQFQPDTLPERRADMDQACCR